MKKSINIQIIAFLSFTFSAYGQKIDVKNDNIMYNGQAVAQIQKDGCGAFSTICQFYVNALDGSPLMTVISLEAFDPLQVNPGNPEGRVRYLRFSFTDHEGIAETSNPSILNTRAKDVSQSIMKAQLIKDGKLDKTAVENFIKVHGTRFSDRQKALNPQIIIVK